VIDVWPPASLPGLTSKTAMPYPGAVSRRADHVAASVASAPGRGSAPGTRWPGTGRPATCSPTTGGACLVMTPAVRMSGVSGSTGPRAVPPEPSTRCTVPWLVSNTPLSTLVTGRGLRVSAVAPVSVSVPAPVSKPRTGKDRSYPWSCPERTRSTS
jgi:hypothetical protein